MHNQILFARAGAAAWQLVTLPRQAAAAALLPSLCHVCSAGVDSPCVGACRRLEEDDLLSSVAIWCPAALQWLKLSRRVLKVLCIITAGVWRKRYSWAAGDLCAGQAT